jgi:hypothetical protein
MTYRDYVQSIMQFYALLRVYASQKSCPDSFSVGCTCHAVAVGDAARKVCVLGYLSTYPARYHVLCADVLRGAGASQD